VLLYFFWVHFQLPQSAPAPYWPEGPQRLSLGLFASLALPAAMWLPSAALALLLRMWPNLGDARQLEARRQVLALDAACYLLLPMVLLVPLLWGYLGNGYIALALCFMGFLTIKAGLLLWVLWRGFLNGTTLRVVGWGRSHSAALFLTALVILFLATAWAQQTGGPSSTESGYLYSAQRLVGMPQEPARKGQPGISMPDSGLRPPQRGRQAYLGELFPGFVAPVFWVGGRLGLLIVTALWSAFLVVVLVKWLLRAGAPPGVAVAATGLVIFSPPLITLCQQVRPEPLCLLLLIIGLDRLDRLGAQPWRAGAGLGVAALILGLLHLDFVPAAVGLLIWGAAQTILTSKGVGRRWLLGLMLAAPIWLLVFLSDWFFAGALSIVQRSEVEPAQALGPVLILALCGLPAAFRFHTQYCFRALTPLVLALGWIWLGGELDPGEHIILSVFLATPLAALCLVPALTALNHPWLRIIAGFPVIMSLGYSWLLHLLPHLRFGFIEGIYSLFGIWPGLYGLSLTKIQAPSGVNSVVLGSLLGVTILGMVVLAVLVWRKAPNPSQVTKPWTEAEALALALLVGGVGLAWIFAKMV
jgi:hypothetical protein